MLKAKMQASKLSQADLARCPADVLDCLGRTGLSCLRFLFHLHSPTGHYDEPEILSYAMPLVCSIGADVRQILGVSGCPGSP